MAEFDFDVVIGSTVEAELSEDTFDIVLEGVGLPGKDGVDGQDGAPAPTNAISISYDDTLTLLGVSSVQEAIVALYTMITNNSAPEETIYNTKSNSNLFGSEIIGFMEPAQDLAQRLNTIMGN